MQNQQPTQEAFRPFTLLLEFLPDQAEESDPAFIHAIGRDTVEALQHNDVTVQPVYTGQQGGDFIVEIVPTIAQFATTVWNNRAIIEEVLNDANTVVTLSGFILTIINHVKQSYEQRVGPEESLARPIKFTVNLDTRSVAIETSNSTQAQDIAKQLASLLPTIPTTNSSTIIPSSHQLKIQPKIPKKRTRRKK